MDLIQHQHHFLHHHNHHQRHHRHHHRHRLHHRPFIQKTNLSRAKSKYPTRWIKEKDEHTTRVWNNCFNCTLLHLSWSRVSISTIESNHFFFAATKQLTNALMFLLFHRTLSATIREEQQRLCWIQWLYHWYKWSFDGNCHGMEWESFKTFGACVKEYRAAESEKFINFSVELTLLPF